MNYRKIAILVTSACLALPLAALFSGCSSVEDTVENSLSFSGPTGEKLDITGHKDTTAKGVKVTKADGTSIEIDEYQSVGNAAAIAEAGAAERSNMVMANLLASVLGAQLNQAGGAALAGTPAAGLLAPRSLEPTGNAEPDNGQATGNTGSPGGGEGPDTPPTVAEESEADAQPAE